MFNWLRYIKDNILNFRYYSRHLTNDNKDKVLGRNIYAFDGTFKEYVWYHTAFHRVVKYAFLVPLIGLVNLIAGRFLVNSVPDKPEFKNLYLFNEAYENALFDWCKYFLLRDVWLKGEVPNLFKVIEYYNNHSSIKILRTFKKLVLTFCKNDSAYLEFCNCLVLNLTKTMNEKYKGEYLHLFYVGDGINDVFYFMLKDKFELINCKLFEKETNETRTINPKH
jgi:hypothetical protein